MRAVLIGRPKAAVRQIVWYWRLRHPQNHLRLHLGCGQKRLDGFVNIDQNFSAATDFICDITKLPCPPNSVERIETYHVIEHLPLPLVAPTLKSWHAILRKGGVFVVECPDLRADCQEFLTGNTERLFSIFGRQRFPGDAHHWGYTAESLCTLLREVGFEAPRTAEPIDYHSITEPCIRIEAVR